MNGMLAMREAQPRDFELLDASEEVRDRLLPSLEDSDSDVEWSRHSVVLRPAGSKAALALLASAIAAVVLGAAWRGGSQSRSLRWQVQKPLLFESQALCGRPQKDVELRTGTALFELGNVPSPELCLSACKRNEACQVWTWRPGPGRNPLGACSLKGLGVDEEPHRSRAPGLVSGRKCPSDMLQASSAMETSRSTAVVREGRATPRAAAFALATRCGIAEEGLDYWTKLPLYQLADINSPEACCRVCQKELPCQAWTWGKSDSKPGLANVCFLKGFSQPSERPDKHPNPQVVSGRACRTMDNQAMSCDAPLITVHSCGDVEDDTDYWTENSLVQVGSIGSAEDCDKTCRSTEGCAVWTWGKSSADPGVAHVCFTKGLRMDEEPSKHDNPNVQSGRLCSFRPFAARNTTTLASTGTTTTSSSEALSTNITTKLSTTTSATNVTLVGTNQTTSQTHNRSAGSTTTITNINSNTSSTTAATVVTTTPTTTTSSSSLTTVTTSSSSITTTVTSSSTSTTSSNTTTTTTTFPTTTTSKEPFHPDSLYCFAVMQPTGNERKLVTHQFHSGVSIFACDESTVFSSKAMELAPGLNTTAVKSDLHCKKGGEFMTALNTEIFFAVWDEIISERRFNVHSWTVKVDPDCVFLPFRLRLDLQHHYEGPNGVYINNCRHGLHGPLEVFSRIAVLRWSQGRKHCVDHFARVCSGPCLWGEDMFIDQCLSKVLGVRREDDWSLLQEDHCDPPLGWKSCLDVTKAAYHPFKDQDDWERCMRNAGGYR